MVAPALGGHGGDAASDYGIKLDWLNDLQDFSMLLCLLLNQDNSNKLFGTSSILFGTSSKNLRAESNYLTCLDNLDGCDIPNNITTTMSKPVAALDP